MERAAACWLDAMAIDAPANLERFRNFEHLVVAPIEVGEVEDLIDGGSGRNFLLIIIVIKFRLYWDGRRREAVWRRLV